MYYVIMVVILQKEAIILERMLYCEVNAFCILILVLLIFKMLTSMNMQNNQRLFLRVLVSIIILICLDFVWVFINQTQTQDAVTFNYIINGLYFIQTGFASYYWFDYSEHVQNSNLVDGRKRRLISLIPLVLLTCLVLISFKTGWLFYIDDLCVYHRGPLYFIQLILTYGYIVFTALHSLISACKRENYEYRSRYVSLASFIVLPLVFGFAQVFLPGIPLLCLGVTLSILCVYLDFQEQRISVDPLTQLNNRNQLMKYLASKEKKEVGNQGLYLLMLDVDYFKKINDKYGHIEGDKVLTLVANTLRKCGTDYNSFCARYGGDEFIMVCESISEQMVKELCTSITNAFSQLNEQNPYTISISIGYCEYTERIKSIQELIQLADNELYKVKRERKHK